MVAVLLPDKSLRLAWCGDSRAYWMAPGRVLEKLTSDHNLAEEYRASGMTDFPVSFRSLVTSHMARTEGSFGDVGTAAPPSGPGRLLLCSDGLYSPFEDADADIGAVLAAGTPREAASRLVRSAMTFPARRRDNATALVADIS
ncbi:hypothetical protein AB0J01_28225 [Streptomyces sp. NPDC050204]|uniref:PP2C family protein-serine/threonine phosphatase n=1 Tax=Streptomyces sp. NPDC050204 TaxID=3155514 RepID=UPI003430FF46